ncbi:hypothetical protein O181_002073 [Austropuccinia psidii MF-1]|uniref:Uncharacterized protein n=1 Tax=Austropuccinia psidii MF-1 TaxID=1389203 RepID=A0A9Q3BC18_9BASI|nr:hypothetical protein [Austropuccinia psidii MF-1]
MTFQHSPPAKNTRSQRSKAVLTPTARAPLYCTPSVTQLSSNLDRGPLMEGEAPSRRGGMKSRRSRSFSGFLGGYPGNPQGPRRRLGLLSQADPNLLKMMKQMTQFMGNLTHAVSPRDNSRAPAFKNPSINATDSFYGTQAHILRVFSQSCQLIFHNDPENFFSDRKKVLYSTSFLTGRDEKWIEPYISNISTQNLSYLNSWQFFETQLFTLIGDPNESRKAEKELDNLRMKESGHISLRGLKARLLDKLASHPGNFHSLQEPMDITLELDNRYHERQKEKVSRPDKKSPVTGSNSFRTPQDSSSKNPHHKKSEEGKNFQVSKDKPHSALLKKENQLNFSENERSIKEGL